MNTLSVCWIYLGTDLRCQRHCSSLPTVQCIATAMDENSYVAAAISAIAAATATLIGRRTRSGHYVCYGAPRGHYGVRKIPTFQNFLKCIIGLISFLILSK